MSIRLHTPGPWTVDYTDDNLRIRAGDLLIAEVMRLWAVLLVGQRYQGPAATGR